MLAGCTGNAGLSAPTPIAFTPPPVAASPSPIITVVTAEPAAAAISTPVPTLLPAPTEISPTPYPTAVVTTTPTPTVAVATQEPTAAATSTPVPTNLPAPAEVLATSLCACDPACSCQINHVVIISIDGLRPDALEQADTPILDGLRTQGAYSPAAQAVLPSVTLVNHASMLSGMSPAKHGIYWNSNDPDLGKIKGPTLFSAAHEAGLSTAMVVGKPKLEHLVVPGSVDNYIYAGFTDRQVVNEVIPLIQTNMPALLFIHLPDVDSAGHAVGWMSLAQLLAVSMTDSLIGEIVAALQEQDYLSQTLLIITADHGGSGRRHGSDSPEDMTVPWLAVGPGVPAGVVLPGEITTYDTAATALSALRVPIPSEWDGRPVPEIIEQVPQ